MLVSRLLRPVTAPPTPSAPSSAISPEFFRGLVASRQPFFTNGLEYLATQLPTRDEELYRWLEGAIEANDALMFIYTISAAAIAERRLPASLLPRGSCLMRTDHEFAWIAWHCEGDVTEALLQAVRDGGLSAPRQAIALCVATAWWQKHRTGPEPAEILGWARNLTRGGRMNNDVHAYLNALFHLTANTDLQSLIPLGGHELIRRTGMEIRDSLLGMVEGSFAGMVPEKKELGFNLGRPLRRAVEKIGRNEGCPCGSGKKYKLCCAKEDKYRLQHSSDVAGLTTAELNDELGAHLSKARLEEMPAHELARLKPREIPPELIGLYLGRLAGFRRYDELLQAFKTFGVEGEREADWVEAFMSSVKDWRPELALRLLKIHPRKKEMLPRLQPAARILLGSKNPATFCRAVEDEAIAALKSGDLEALRSVAQGVIHSPLRALGILVARGVLPLVENAPEVFAEILEARDLLNLPPQDDFCGFMEERAARRRKNHDHEALREMQERYEAKAAEARLLNEAKVKAERELALREKRAHIEAAANQPVLAADTEKIQQLRARVKWFGAREKEKSAEQAADQRRMREMEQELEQLRAAALANESKPDGEMEELGETFEVPGNQPVRLITFPKGFADTLAGFPKHVGRATMSRLGRLAGGEPSAFDRIKQLKAYPEVLRARISDKHRLLFCLEHDRIRVVDLIWRANLDRRIERLQVAGLPPIS